MHTLPHTSNWKKLVGNTPLLELNSLFPDKHFRLYAKLELFNPGGSMKDRPAFNILSAALRDGDVNPGGMVIESSSGNMGIGLAQACLHFGLRFICVVDERANLQNLKIMRSLGAQIETVRPTRNNTDLLALRIQRVRKLVKANPGSYWPNQYANPANAGAYHALMSELTAILGSNIDYLFCAVGTCGTIRGCADYIAARGLPTKVIAVDATGSVIFGGAPGKRLIPGHGSSMTPELFRPGMVDQVVYSDDSSCVAGCRLLLEREALLTGGSSGAVVMALKSYANKIPEGANVVMILADRGDRYLDTIYNDAWVSEKLGSKGASS